MRIHCLQHFEPEEAGLIGEWAAEKGHEFLTTRLYEGEPLPDATPGDGIVVMGGPMNVDEDDKYPWLAPEKAFLARHMAEGGRVFGVCLGGQLIARALGATVRRNPVKEIGWMAVHFTPEARASGIFAGFPQSLVVLQWHGDTFDIPAGTTKAAWSDACANQAFCVGTRIVALQFHLEAEGKEVADFVRFFDDELAQGGPHVQSGQAIAAGLDEHLGECRRALYTLLDHWVI